MAMQDAKPTDSPLGMAIASNAMLGEIIQVLINKNVISRMELMNAVAAARRRVNTVSDRTEHHAAADSVLDALQKRFPVA